jgi:hypothetical protein
MWDSICLQAYAACLKRALKNALRPSVTALAGSCDFTITPEEQEAAEDHTYDGSGCVHIAFNAANSLCNLLMGDGKVMVLFIKLPKLHDIVHPHIARLQCTVC